MLACVLICALGAALGVALGFCFRNPVVGIVTFLVWTSMGEALIGVVVPEGLLPTGAMRVAAAGEGPLSGWLSVLVVAGYAAAAAIVARRRYLVGGNWHSRLLRGNRMTAPGRRANAATRFLGERPERGSPACVARREHPEVVDAVVAATRLSKQRHAAGRS